VAVGAHYLHFPQVEDGEVVAILAEARRRRMD
jgi:predicted phosphoribosyltransferase